MPKISPITFSVPMVRALLDGRKTQTRRVLNPQPTIRENGSLQWEKYGGGICGARDKQFADFAADLMPHAVGDLLWVREPWWVPAWLDEFSPAELPIGDLIYRQTDPKQADAGRYRQARFMCRWMSRLTLVVTDVRVHRLQEITRGDAMEEGCPFPNMADGADPRHWYADLWNHINGPDAWAANPWVAAYTFDVHQTNVDAYLARQAEAA